MIAPDTITFARPTVRRTTLAKVIHVRGGRIVGKDASPNVTTFDYTEAPVRDLRTLYIQVRLTRCSSPGSALRLPCAASPQPSGMSHASGK